MRSTYSPTFVPVLISLIISTGCSLVDSTTENVEQVETDLGTLIVIVQTRPEGREGAFQFTGVPTGGVSTQGALIISDLEPGTYTSTEVDPAPDFDVSKVDCDDDDSPTPSIGDASSRTAVFNLDPGETVTCTFTNSQRGTLVLASRTIPEGREGMFQFTGVPTGPISAQGTLVTSNLAPGTYSSTEIDPAPDFDLTRVECDDDDSPTPSSGDATTRTAVFNLDPGETITCTFTNTQRGTLIVAVQTIPEGGQGTFQFTGVPTGIITSPGTLVTSNLEPGTYTSTEVNATPNFNVTEVECDDDDSPTPSSGDASTRSAVFNLDPGETIECVFTNELAALAGDGRSGGSGDSPEGEPVESRNAFDNPSDDLEGFPIPTDLPQDAGEYSIPRQGSWFITHWNGELNCGDTISSIPASPPETGTLDVQDEGETLVGTGLESSQNVSITLTKNPQFTGRYFGSLEVIQEGVPATVNYFWQLVTDEYIIGYLTGSVTNQGITCSIYRPFEMMFEG